MIPSYDDFLIKRFEQPDEVRTFEKGYFEMVKIGAMTIGRASYEPGWKWSQHVGLVTGATSCEVEHVGLVISGSAACRMNDGRYYEMKAGDLFYIGPGHDSWVVVRSPTFHSISSELSIMPGLRTVNGELHSASRASKLVSLSHPQGAPECSPERAQRASDPSNLSVQAPEGATESGASRMICHIHPRQEYPSPLFRGSGIPFVYFPEFRCASLRAIFLCTSGAFPDAWRRPH